MYSKNKASLQILGPHSMREDGSFIPFDEQIAILSHYIHNRGSKFAIPYETVATGLIEDISDVEAKPKQDGILSDTSAQYSLFSELFSVPFLPKDNYHFTFIDLFAGIGGFRMAMQNLGGKCVFSSEWDSQAQKTYLLNYGELPFGDITKEVTKAFIPDDFDILCAGFPCQAFSMAGKRLGFEETRGTLFFEVARLIEERKPKAFFLENVEGIVNHDGGKTLEVIENTLISLGYNFDWKVMNASDYGVPQNRKRWYCIGFRNDLNIGFDGQTNEKYKCYYHFPNKCELKKSLKEIVLPDYLTYLLRNLYAGQ